VCDVKSGDAYVQPASGDDMAVTKAGPELLVTKSMHVNGTSLRRKASDPASKECTSEDMGLRINQLGRPLGEDGLLDNQGHPWNVCALFIRASCCTGSEHC